MQYLVFVILEYIVPFYLVTRKPVFGVSGFVLKT